MSYKSSLIAFDKLISTEQEYIRKLFQQPSSQQIYIDYETFMKNFLVKDSNFKDENLNIIDVHLRYRWWIRQEMAIYKWTPILLMTPVIMKHWFLLLMVPYATTKLFDHYFESYFLWKHRKDKIINIREQFATKLSKTKNKVRRMELFKSISPVLKIQNKEELPYKYIKFGQFSQYLFHAESEGKEQSSILQTTLFENYLAFRNIIWTLSKPSNIWKGFVQLRNSFSEFKQDPDRHKYKINIPKLIDQPLIKVVQIYAIEDNIDHNIRRFIELLSFIWKGSLQPSEFKLWQYTNFSEYKDIYEPIKYNYKDNNPDLVTYFSIIAVPKLINFIFRRR